MRQLVLVSALSMLTAWNQSGAGQTVTGEPTAAILAQSNLITDNVYQVTGRVLDDVTGRPLSGAMVSLARVEMHSECMGGRCRATSPPPKPSPPRVTTTGADGQFAFDDVPQGYIEVGARKGGYLDVLRPRIDTQPTMNLTSDQRLVLRLAPAASISGIARDHTGAPLEKNGNIALYIVTYWNGWRRAQYAGWPKREVDGTYHFDDLQPGRYYLVVSPPLDRPEPKRTEGKPAVGEVPARYPVPTSKNRSTFFTLREGEQKKIDLKVPEKTLHRVTFTAGPAYVSTVESASGGAYFTHEEIPGEDMFNAWLPDGSYWPNHQQPGEIDGPVPFEVAGADISGLHFDIAAMGAAGLTATAESSIDVPLDLKCGKIAATSCWIASLYLLYLNLDGSTEVVNSVQLNASTQSVVTTLPPGRYTPVVQTFRNLYVKSIRSGAMDLSQGPLLIRPGESPPPIQVELSQAGKVDGLVQREGQSVAAYVYALPAGDAAGTDYRLFAPVESKEDGTFEIEGLAPGPWVIFATDTNLNLDVHDPLDIGYWLDHGSVVNVDTGMPAHLMVEETPTPEP